MDLPALASVPARLASLLRPGWVPARRSARLAALSLLTAIACWGEPGARGAASPQGAAPDSVAGDDEPVLAPAAPPTPLPPQPVGSSAAAAPGVAPSAAPAEAPPTPVTRPSAAPALLVDHVGPRLQELTSWVHQHHAELGFALRDLGSGRELLAEGAARALNPASNQKLITAAVALSELGPQFRYHVAVLGKIEAGVAARLVLRGNGDPSFSFEELRGFAERLVAAGLKRVSGEILVDQSAFDDQYTPPAFDQQPGEWAAFRAPVSAVALDRNSTTLHVFPTKAGELARVEFEPPGYVLVQGQVRTEKGQKRDHVGLTVKPHGLLLSAEVSGTIPEGGEVVHVTRRIDNPELYAGIVLKRVLVNLGVDVQGDVKKGGEDETQELIARDSLTLAELVQQLGKASDNFYAETLLKTLGAEKRGKPSTAASGADVELSWLKAQKLSTPDDGLKISNGSGLYDANRVSARTLTRLLEQAYLDPIISRAYQDQLAVGGQDGTLRARFFALRNRRSVHAKTGTLNKVTALSGYVFGPEHDTGVSFSILVNGTSDHAGARKRMDQLVLEISDALWSGHGPVATLARR